MIMQLVKWKKAAEGSIEFVPQSEVPAVAEVVTTIGLAVGGDAEMLVLAQSFNESDGSYASTIAIPRSAIVSDQFKDVTLF
jgi:hypothetical protein